MAKYLIHTCNQRLWYVHEHLIPSMLAQGIASWDIEVYLDKENEGCLLTCMKAFLAVPPSGYTWHMQDDVIICSDFKQRTEYPYEEDIVCGYCYDKDDRKNYTGRVEQEHMWYSFPCIRIANKLARGCGRWFFNEAQFAKEYQTWIKMKKYDDSMFDWYTKYHWTEVSVLNLIPNLVDHIDYLIGGSIINSIRPEVETHAVYFQYKYLIDELKEKLTK